MRNPRFCLPGSAAICKERGTRDDGRRLNVKSIEAGSLLTALRLAAATKPVTAQSAVASRGPVTYECMQAGGGSDRLTATFYQTTPAMVLVEHRDGTRPAFQVPAASGTKYEGRDLLLWDAHGEALVTWSGVELKCRAR